MFAITIFPSLSKRDNDQLKCLGLKPIKNAVVQVLKYKDNSQCINWFHRQVQHLWNWYFKRKFLIHGPIHEKRVVNKVQRIELIYYFTYFHRRPIQQLCFIPVGLFVNTTFSTGLLGVEVPSVSWLGQLTEFKSLIIVIVGFKMFENVVLTTKGLQQRNTQLLDATMVKNR